MNWVNIGTEIYHRTLISSPFPFHRWGHSGRQGEWHSFPRPHWSEEESEMICSKPSCEWSEDSTLGVLMWVEGGQKREAWKETAHLTHGLVCTDKSYISPLVGKEIYLPVSGMIFWSCLPDQKHKGYQIIMSGGEALSKAHASTFWGEGQLWVW